eukprot:scaffold87565_cov31-Tisochrysis_lutea.AAC.1
MEDRIRILILESWASSCARASGDGAAECRLRCDRELHAQDGPIGVHRVRRSHSITRWTGL